jgi:hypothetical protein
MPRLWVYLLTICVAFGSRGCTAPTCPPTRGLIRPPAAGIAPSASYEDLAAVLAAVVDGQGQIDDFELRQITDRLDRQLAVLAVIGPGSTPPLFPTEEDRLAYWYNARAAWSLKLVALNRPWELGRLPSEGDEDVEDDPNAPPRLPLRAFDCQAFWIDGRQMSLRGLDAILAGDGDWRTLVAAPGALVDRAALPDRPFSAADIRPRIAERLVAYLDDDLRFEIDHEYRKVLVRPHVWRYRDGLVTAWNRRFATRGGTMQSALLPYLTGSAERRLQDAVGYGWTVEPPRMRLALRWP